MIGKTKDAGWEIGVSRTIHAPIERVWSVLTAPEGLRLWLGEGAVLPAEKGMQFTADDGTTGELRSLRPLDRIRLTWRPPSWDHESTVQVAVSGDRRKTRLVFHQERLADAHERERQREHWRGVLQRLEPLLSADTDSAGSPAGSRSPARRGTRPS